LLKLHKTLIFIVKRKCFFDIYFCCLFLTKIGFSTKYFFASGSGHSAFLCAPRFVQPGAYTLPSLQQVHSPSSDVILASLKYPEWTTQSELLSSLNANPQAESGRFVFGLISPVFKHKNLNFLSTTPLWLPRAHPIQIVSQYKIRYVSYQVNFYLFLD